VSILRSPLLEEIDVIRHGFGTRSAGLTQDEMASLKQIHSGIVLQADRANGCVGEADALVTAEPGITVSIRTADCLPILIADRRTGAVAAVHAGWRGTVAGIAGAAVDRLSRDFGSRPEDLMAAIGPGIGVCCYEVGEEVARQLDERWAGERHAGRVNLAEHNRRQLERAGLLPKHIDIISPCTYCNADQFWSYRREGERAGRMISFIGRV
jgi:YfiH family protein